MRNVWNLVGSSDPAAASRHRAEIQSPERFECLEVVGADLERAADLKREHDAVVRDRALHDLRARRQRERRLGGCLASLAAEKAIADDAEHRGDGERDRKSTRLNSS